MKLTPVLLSSRDNYKPHGTDSYGTTNLMGIASASDNLSAPSLSTTRTTISSPHLPQAIKIYPNNSQPFPRRLRRVILRHLIDDPTIEFNDPIFNDVITDSPESKLDPRQLLELLNKSKKWIDIDGDDNPVIYYQDVRTTVPETPYDHLSYNQKCNYDFNSNNHSNERFVENCFERESSSPVDLHNDTVRHALNKRKRNSDGDIASIQFNQQDQQSPNIQGLEQGSVDDQASCSQFASHLSFQHLSPDKFGEFPSSPVLTNEDFGKFHQVQDNIQNSYSNLNSLKEDFTAKKSKKLQNPPYNQNSKDNKFRNYQQNQKSEDEEFCKTDVNKIMRKPSSNQNIIKTYGEVYPTENGWVDSNNENLKLSKVLLDKFQKQEIEKITCETEDTSCQVCNEKLANYWDYVAHIDKHNSAIADYHFKHVHFCPVEICPMSLIGFTKKRDLRHHVHNYHYYRSNIVEKYKPWEPVMRNLSYNCIWPGCSSSFCRKDVLTRHIKLNHQKNSDLKQGECYNCHTSKTSLWYKDPDSQTICNACYQFLRKYHTSRPSIDRRLTATEGKRLVKERVPRWNINDPL